ncbi:MAG: dihydrofolate reductase [Patescibacteria group bacterium]
MISIIAIIGKNRELGKDNKLLWDMPEDMKRFKELTQGHAVIMGRKTYESIGKKLEGRNNIVITENKNYEAKGCTVVCSIKKAIEYAQEMDREEVFIIGGAQIYEQALPYADKLYLTVVDKEAEADTYFPEYSEFDKVIKEEEKETEDGLRYKFLELNK